MPLPSWTDQVIAQPPAPQQDLAQLAADEYIDPANPKWGLRSEWRYTTVKVGDQVTTVYQRVDCQIPVLPLMTFTPWGNPDIGGMHGKK